MVDASRRARWMEAVRFDAIDRSTWLSLRPASRCWIVVTGSVEVIVAIISRAWREDKNFLAPPGISSSRILRRGVDEILC